MRPYLADIVTELHKQWPDNRALQVVCHGHSVPAGYFATPVVDTFNAYPHLLHRGLKERFPFAVVNVIVTAIGADGKGVSDTSKGELTVKVAAPPPAPPASQSYDCVGTLARISAVFPVRFKFNHDDLADPFALAVNQYAALLKDPRCVAIKMQVAGHADFLGSEAFNQGLSERRAKTVIDALVKAGIDAGRLTGIGYSKDRPIDPARSADARAKNRRVEFTVMK